MEEPNKLHTLSNLSQEQLAAVSQQTLPIAVTAATRILLPAAAVGGAKQNPTGFTVVLGGVTLGIFLPVVGCCFVDQFEQPYSKNLVVGRNARRLC